LKWIITVFNIFSTSFFRFFNFNDENLPEQKQIKAMHLHNCVIKDFFSSVFVLAHIHYFRGVPVHKNNTTGPYPYKQFSMKHKIVEKYRRKRDSERERE